MKTGIILMLLVMILCPSVKVAADDLMPPPEVMGFDETIPPPELMGELQEEIPVPEMDGEKPPVEFV